MYVIMRAHTHGGVSLRSLRSSAHVQASRMETELAGLDINFRGNHCMRDTFRENISRIVMRSIFSLPHQQCFYIYISASQKRAAVRDRPTKMALSVFDDAQFIFIEH